MAQNILQLEDIDLIHNILPSSYLQENIGTVVLLVTYCLLSYYVAHQTEEKAFAKGSRYSLRLPFGPGAADRGCAVFD